MLSSLCILSLVIHHDFPTKDSRPEQLHIIWLRFHLLNQTWNSIWIQEERLGSKHCLKSVSRSTVYRKYIYSPIDTTHGSKRLSVASGDDDVKTRKLTHLQILLYSPWIPGHFENEIIALWRISVYTFLDTVWDALYIVIARLLVFRYEKLNQPPLLGLDSRNPTLFPKAQSHFVT